MDNLVELVIFTPVGSFKADPDFGLEYWNYEYVNISDAQFNTGTDRVDYCMASMKELCEASIAESIKTYAPEKLKVAEIKVTMNLRDDDSAKQGSCKVYSHHTVAIYITAKLDNGMGTYFQYSREVSFMVEPTAKRIII